MWTALDGIDCNTIRGYAAEFGLTAAKGMTHLVPLLERIEADESLPALARELFAIQAKEYVQLQAQIDEVDAKLTAWQPHALGVGFLRLAAEFGGQRTLVYRPFQVTSDGCNRCEGG